MATPTQMLGAPPRVRSWRPDAQLQQESSDCGIAAAAALAAMYGREVCASQLRLAVGSTARGLTIRQVRDVLRLAGFGAEVISGAGSRLLCARGPAVVLWKKKHFVVLGRGRWGSIEVFDPARGWRRMHRAELDKELAGFAVIATSVPDVATVQLRSRFPLFRWLSTFGTKRLLGGVVAVTLIAQLLAIGLPWLTGKIVDASTAKASDNGSITFAIFAVASGFALVARTISAETTARLRRRLSVQISGDISRRVFAKPIDYLRRHSPDLLGARIVGANQLQELLSDNLPNLVVNSVLLVGAITMICLVNPVLALLSLSGVAVKSLIDYALQPQLIERQESEFWCRVKYQSILLDFLRSAHAMRQYQAIPTVLRRLDDEAVTHAASSYERGRLARLQSAGHGLVDVIDRTLFVLVGGWLIRNSGVSAGAFLALTLYRETMVASLDALRTIRITVGSARGSAARLEDIVDAKTLALPVGSETPGIITSGKVSIRELSYRYSLFSEWIFSNFSLEVRDGENIAIVAPSGSGKTTLAKLICGALKPCRGQVVVGDVDVHDTGGEMALRAIGTVMQDDALCAGSIRENIEMFRGLSQQDIEAAARVAELHDWVQSLPMRYETDISDSVTTLSGGQRQRILIARAICGSARLLVMDEATSHLDVATEHAILDRVRKLGVTTITFAHRPETIRRADRIIDLQRDRIGNQEAA